MFFEDSTDIQRLAQQSGCSIFVLPDDIPIDFKHDFLLTPEDTTTITIDQVRNLAKHLIVKNPTHRFIIIRPADALSEDASNALLKNLEEPKDNYHFLLITKNPSALLPTILSRSALYILKVQPDFNTISTPDFKIKILAKQLITASPQQLISLAEQISKIKINSRGYTLNVLSSAIEILYKSYCKTKNPIFLQKLPKFISTYENIAQNGHIKLHLIADLL